MEEFMDQKMKVAYQLSKKPDIFNKNAAEMNFGKVTQHN